MSNTKAKLKVQSIDHLTLLLPTKHQPRPIRLQSHRPIKTPLHPSTKLHPRYTELRLLSTKLQSTKLLLHPTKLLSQSTKLLTQSTRLPLFRPISLRFQPPTKLNLHQPIRFLNTSFLPTDLKQLLHRFTQRPLHLSRPFTGHLHHYLYFTGLLQNKRHISSEFQHKCREH